MSEGIIQRAELLIQQKRFSDAEKLLQGLLQNDPNDVHVLMLLSEVNLQKENFDKAEKLIGLAIGLAPGYALLFYIKARIHLQKEKYDETESALNQALTIDPADADYYSLLANIKLIRKQYDTALELANKSLSLEPDNLLGLNTRSSALLKLNKKEESFQTIEGALREDPNNAFTHTTYGWNLLEKGEHKKALVHFREALKNDPSFENAKVGMVEALKASNFFYRMFLKYSFFMSNLTAKYQWAVFIGFYVSVQILNRISKNNKDLEPYLFPLIMLLCLFAFSTWVLTPFSNLFLRLNKYGKHLLSDKQKISSNFVGLSLLVFLFGLISFIATWKIIFLGICVYGFTMMIPLSKMFASKKNKLFFGIYPIAMAMIGFISLVNTYNTKILVSNLAIIYFFGFVAFQWISNFLMIKEDNV